MTMMSSETDDNNNDDTSDSSNQPASHAQGGRRRRKRARPVIDNSVPSPCVAICEYDGEGYCKGCSRDADEIRDWMIMTREQKLALLDVLAERRKQSGQS